MSELTPRAKATIELRIEELVELIYHRLDRDGIIAKSEREQMVSDCVSDVIKTAETNEY